MTYVRKWLKNFILIGLMSVCLSVQSHDSSEDISEQEIDLICKNPEIQFAYVPDNIREIILTLIDNEYCAQVFVQLRDDLKRGGHIGRQADLCDLVPILINLLPSNRPAFRADLLEYQRSLENGEALIIGDEAVTRKFKSKVFCSLMVKCRLITNKLNVRGDTIIEGNLQVNGDIVGLNGFIGVTPAGEPGAGGTSVICGSYTGEAAGIDNCTATAINPWYFQQVASCIEVWARVQLTTILPNVLTAFNITVPPAPLTYAPNAPESIGLWIGNSGTPSTHWGLNGIVVPLPNSGFTAIRCESNEGPEGPATSGIVHIHFRYTTDSVPPPIPSNEG